LIDPQWAAAGNLAFRYGDQSTPHDLGSCLFRHNSQFFCGRRAHFSIFNSKFILWRFVFLECSWSWHHVRWCCSIRIMLHFFWEGKIFWYLWKMGSSCWQWSDLL